jgi:hypothetical protein
MIQTHTIPMAINYGGTPILEPVKEFYVQLKVPFTGKRICAYWSRIANGYWRIRLGWMV